MSNQHTDIGRCHACRDPEAAKRFADDVLLHQWALTRDEILDHRFMAVRLSDGGSDRTAYETREEAARHQSIPGRYGYPQIPLARWSQHTCDSLLFYLRRAYDAGYRWEPKSELIIPTRPEDYARDVMS